MIQKGFDWVGRNPREVLSAIAAIIVIGGLVAGGYEWRRRTENKAARLLEEIERGFSESMGADRRIALVPEPANADQAQRSREEALEKLERFIAEQEGSRAVDFAALRAAEMETDLGRFGDAEKRLGGLSGHLGSEDVLRPVADRLRGYVLEEQGEHLRAGEAFVAAAEAPGYPDPASVWLSAAEAFRRSGETDRAAHAYQQILEADPLYAANKRVLDRLSGLEPTPPVEPATPAQNEPVSAP